jgi:hypothetical protein
MGGSPKIDGGMTMKEQSQLQAEERAFLKEQELERRAAAEATEARRVQREASDRARMQKDEQAQVMAATLAEKASIEEAQAQTEAQAKGTIGAANTKSLDFLGSLYTGINVNKLS